MFIERENDGVAKEKERERGGERQNGRERDRER